MNPLPIPFEVASTSIDDYCRNVFEPSQSEQWQKSQARFKYHYTLNMVKRCGLNPARVCDLTDDFFRRFRVYLVARGLKPITIHDHCRRLWSIGRHAGLTRGEAGLHGGGRRGGVGRLVVGHRQLRVRPVEQPCGKQQQHGGEQGEQGKAAEKHGSL